MSRVLRSLIALGLTLGLFGLLSGAGRGAASDPEQAGPGQGSRVQGGRRILPTAQKTAKKKARTKKGTPKQEAPAATETAKPAPADDNGLKFSTDIAPILVANCIRCHDGKKKAFDMLSFETLIKGAKSGKVIAPGMPDESHLVLRIKGEETPKMPQGGNNNLSDEAIAKIERWVKEGARLDTGIDPKAPMEKYAATPEMLRKAALAKMSPEERDKAVERVGLERWKKGNSKTTPEVSPSTHFMLFSNLPKQRIASTLKVMEQKYTQLKALLGPSALEWPEKTSLYVYNDRNSFVQFVRNGEGRDAERDTFGTTEFANPQPYVAVVDPSGGKDEAPAPTPRRTGRSRKSEADEPASTERSLASLLTEYLAIGVLSNAGKPPRWMTLGVGAYLASTTDPRSAYTHRLRKSAYDLGQLGWNAKALEALGDDTKPEDIRAIGFAVNEWLAASSKDAYPAFVQGMLAGGNKLDDVIQNVLGGNRAEFLAYSGEWVARYGAGR
jgi:hypothetical protein